MLAAAQTANLALRFGLEMALLAPEDASVDGVVHDAGHERDVFIEEDVVPIPDAFPDVPIVSETTPVMKSSALNCGGFGPSGKTSCGLVISSVVAPLQEMSTNFGSAVDGAARWG